MEKKSIKVEILDMKYEKEDHIFIMDVLDMDRDEKITFAMRAEDFGISRDMVLPLHSEVIKKFCKEMKGKEKNLFIEEEIYKGYSDKPSKAEVEKLQEDMDRYPYKELIRKKLNEG